MQNNKVHKYELSLFFELLSIYFFRADTTIALSETTKNKLLKLEYDTDNVKVIYPGIWF